MWSQGKRVPTPAGIKVTSVACKWVIHVLTSQTWFPAKKGAHSVRAVTTDNYKPHLVCIFFVHQEISIANYVYQIRCH